MFIKHYIYSLKYFIRNKSLTFWGLIFPLLLGTMFHLGFGNLINEDGKPDPVPVAVVTEKDTPVAQHFQELLTTLSTDDDPILTTTAVDLEKAESLLKGEKVDGILILGDDIQLTIAKSSINQTILKNIVDIYLHKTELINEVAQTPGANLEAVIASLSEEVTYLKEISFSDSKATINTQYFYALIAMTCLYGSFFGLTMATQLQSNLSSLAMRRCSSPTKKIYAIMCDFLAVLTIDFGIILILFAYIIFVIKADFGNQFPLTLLTAFVGCIFGLSMGSFIGSVTAKSFEMKIGISLGVSMVLSFLSGLMIGTIPNIIEKALPIVNRLNPALLISNSFYCLTFYDNYQVYTRNMLTLLTYSVLLCTGSILLLRRKKYASL